MKKNKNKTLLLFLAVLSFAVGSKAQAPGYMGRKFVAGYGFYVHPSFGNLVMDYSNKLFNKQHEFFIEAVSGKRFSLGLSARLYRYTYNNVAEVDVNGASNSSTFSQFEEHPSGSYLIKARNYLFYGKSYRSAYLAPWGKYFVFGVLLTQYTTTYNPDEMSVNAETRNYGVTTQKTYSDFGPTVQAFQSFDMFIGNGNNRIYGNRIVLDYGYNINLIAMSKMFFNAVEDWEAEYVDTYIENTSNARVAAVNRFNLYIKVGFLF